MSRWLLALALLLIAAAGVGRWMYVSSAIFVRTASVTRGGIEEFVEERGKTRLSHVYDISMPHNGRLERIELAEGDRVEWGQVVARIVPADLDNQVAEAQAAVDRLTASIAENNDHSVEERTRQQSEQFVSSMQRTVDAAAARKIAGAKQVEFAEKYFNRRQELFRRNVETLENVEQAELDLVQRQVEHQQDILVWQSTQSILVATELLPRIIDAYVTHKSLIGEVLQRQKDEAAVRLERALTDRTRGTMRSPVAGIVLERPVDNEQFVTAGTSLVKIGRSEDLEIEVDVLSQDATRIPHNAVATIDGLLASESELPRGGNGDTSDLASRAIRGTVRRIYPRGFTKISSLGVEEQRVRVIIALDEAARRHLQELRVGVDYRVRVRIVTAARSDALVVPRAALFRGSAGQWQTFVIRNQRAELQAVEVGLLNDDFAEIVAGLQDQDSVVLSPDNELVAGSRVATNVASSP